MAGLKVRSSKMCFYHNRRYRPGEVFELPEGTKLAPDMEIVTEKSAPTVAKPKAKDPETFSELNKAQAKAEADAMKAKETGPKGK